MIKNNIKTKKDNINHEKYFFNNKNILGFWIYLMSDCILFATIFSVYCVMSKNIFFNNYFFNLKTIFLETLILLFSSVFYGIALVSTQYNKRNYIYLFLSLTLLCGVSFIICEIYEFYNLICIGYTPQSNGFLSSFFTLVGLHGIHVLIGLLWMIIIFFQLMKVGVNNIIYMRMLCLGLFWHFLDIIWICVFTIIYLIGSIS